MRPIRDRFFKTITIALSALTITGSTPAMGEEFNHELTDYAIFAWGNMSFRERANVTGLIGSGRDISFREDCIINNSVYFKKDFSSRERVKFGGDILGGDDMSFRFDIDVAGNVMAFEDINIQRGTHIGGDVLAGGNLWVDSTADIDGSQLADTDPTDSWVPEMVTFPSFAPGNQDISLAQNQTHTIDPGNYRDLNVRQNCTIKLRTGSYHFRNVTMRENLKWEIDDSNGPVHLIVRNSIATRENTRFTPSSGSADGFYLWTRKDMSFRENNRFIGQIRVKDNLALRENFVMTGTIFVEKDFSARENLRIKTVSTPPVFYVRTNGSDSSDGTTPGTAFRTIQRGVNSCIEAGTTLYVGPGEYQEQVEIGTGRGTAAVSGTDSRPTRMIADIKGQFTKDDPGEVIISGRGQSNSGIDFRFRSDWIISNFTLRDQRDQAFWIVTSGLTIDHCTIEVGDHYGLYAVVNDDFVLRDCTFERPLDSGRITWITPAQGTTPYEIKVTGNDAALTGARYLSRGYKDGWNSALHRSSNTYNRYIYGFMIFGWGTNNASSIEISNNQISDSYLPIYVFARTSSPTELLISNNTMSGCLYGVYGYIYGRGNARIYNNIVESCYYGTFTYAWGGGTLDVKSLLENNIVYNMARYRRPYEFDIIHGDPLFTDPVNGDYSLKSGSPAIDTGNARYAPRVDIAGRSRPSDGDNDGVAQVDIGAYELVSAPDRVRVVQWKEVGGDHNE